MALSSEEAAPLKLLLKAQSKTTVVHIIKEGFNHRRGKVPDEVLASVAKSIDLQPLEAVKLLQSVTLLIRNALYEGFSESSTIARLLPDDFHGDLRKLVSDIIAKNIPDWRNQALQNQVSLPKLIDFDWRVDIKTASDSVSRMATPTCLVQMKIQEPVVSRTELPTVQSVNVEFSKETLDTMLDGLGKIRDQLSSVAKTSSS